MRLLAVALLLLLPFADQHAGTSSVTLAGAGAPASFEGTAYFIPGMEGMGVMALATAPLEDGTWAHQGQPFSYVEIVVFEALSEGAIEVGTGARVLVAHWEDHEDGPAFSAMADGGTLTLTSLTDTSAVGTLAATLTAYDGAGNEQAVTVEARFVAVPGNIPSP